MNKIVDKRCLTFEVLEMHVEGVDTNLTNEVLKELVKAVAMVVKEYKISVSLNTIETRGVEVLQDLLNAVESNKIKERVNKDGIVNIDWKNNAIVFIPRPTCLDQIITKNKKNLGNIVVQVLQYMKENYDTKEVKALYDYYSFSDIKFCVKLHELAGMLYKLTGVNHFHKVAYAMHYKEHFKITVKSKYSSRYRSNFTTEFIYLGSVK